MTSATAAVHVVCCCADTMLHQLGLLSMLLLNSVPGWEDHAFMHVFTVTTCSILLRIRCISSAGSQLGMYTCCVSAGYVLRDGPSMTSTEKQAYAYDTEAVSG